MTSFQYYNDILANMCFALMNTLISLTKYMFVFKVR